MPTLSSMRVAIVPIAMESSSPAQNACSVHYVPRHMQRATCDMRPATHSMQHAAHAVLTAVQSPAHREAERCTHRRQTASDAVRKPATLICSQRKDEAHAGAESERNADRRPCACARLQRRIGRCRRPRVALPRRRESVRCSSRSEWLRSEEGSAKVDKSPQPARQRDPLTESLA